MLQPFSSDTRCRMTIVSKKLFLTSLCTLALLAGCAKQPSQSADNASNQPSAAASNQPNASGTPGTASGAAGSSAASKASAGTVAETLPVGTIITVRLNNAISTKTANRGDRFSATVANPVQVNGQTVIPAGSTAEGVVSDVRARGRFKGGSLLRREDDGRGSICTRRIAPRFSASVDGHARVRAVRCTTLVRDGGGDEGRRRGDRAAGGHGAVHGPRLPDWRKLARMSYSLCCTPSVR